MYLDNIFINCFNFKLKQKQTKILAEVIALAVAYTIKAVFTVLYNNNRKNMSLHFMLKTTMSVNLKLGLLKPEARHLYNNRIMS